MSAFKSAKFGMLLLENDKGVSKLVGLSDKGTKGMSGQGMSCTLFKRRDILFWVALEMSLKSLISLSIIDLGVLRPERSDMFLLTSRSAISLQIRDSSGVNT